MALHARIAELAIVSAVVGVRLTGARTAAMRLAANKIERVIVAVERDRLGTRRRPDSSSEPRPFPSALRQTD